MTFFSDSKGFIQSQRKIGKENDSTNDESQNTKQFRRIDMNLNVNSKLT